MTRGQYWRHCVTHSRRPKCTRPPATPCSLRWGQTCPSADEASTLHTRKSPEVWKIFFLFILIAFLGGTWPTVRAVCWRATRHRIEPQQWQWVDFCCGLLLTEIFTARGSCTWAPVVIDCLLCFLGNTLLSASRADKWSWVYAIQILKSLLYAIQIPKSLLYAMQIPRSLI
jgi:hypothetical protein